MADEKAKPEEKKAPKAPAAKAEGEAAPAKGAAEGAEGAEGDAKAKIKKNKRKVDVQGACTVKATFNNTIISIMDVRGNVVSWGSPGKVGFKGSRKSTPFAAQVAAESAANAAIEMGMRKVDVRVKGGGQLRESIILTLKTASTHNMSIKDVTGFTNNGFRPNK